MENKFNFLVDINTLIAHKMGFESYFVLHCIATKNEALMLSYTRNCKLIDTTVFRQLEKNNYITIDGEKEGKIYFKLLSLASFGEEILRDSITPIDLEKQFGEFRACYPSSVKSGLTSRRLHGNLSKCKKLYEKLLMETTHEILCKCAELYTQEKFKTGNQIYMQNLETWLNQKNYEQYLDDVEKTTNFTTNTDFTDDI